MTTDSVDALAFLRSLDPEPLSIAKVLWAHRLGEEMTQKQFSKILGISTANLCDIEKKRRFVSPKRAARFAKALQLSEILFVQLALQDILKNDGFKNVGVKIIKLSPVKANKSSRKAPKQRNLRPRQSHAA